MFCDFIWFIENMCNELDINHIKSQTMEDSFYHIFATLYLLFVWTLKPHNFNFGKKLRKIDVTINTA
jgi:hypothetical protein